MKLKISDHEINIETSKYDKTSRCDRICLVCDLNIEDKTQFLFDCPNNDTHQLETTFFNKIENRIPN